MLEREVELEGFFVLHGEAALQLAAKRDNTFVICGESHSLGDASGDEVAIHVEHCQKFTEMLDVPVFRVLCPCGNVAVVATPAANLFADFCCQKCFDSAEKEARSSLAAFGVGGAEKSTARAGRQ
jgi:hypothetical protein